MAGYIPELKRKLIDFGIAVADADTKKTPALKLSANVIYWGIFIRPADLPCTLKWLPHVTCFFPKTKEDRLLCTAEFAPLLGDHVELTITGISVNKAGIAYIVEHTAACESYFAHIDTPHITLSVNNGYKAVDVGLEANEKNIHVFARPLILTGIFSVFC